jgi:hypothetical protein
VKVTIDLEAVNIHARMVNTHLLVSLDALLAQQDSTALHLLVCPQSVLRVPTQAVEQTLAQPAQTGMHAH